MTAVFVAEQLLAEDLAPLVVTDRLFTEDLARILAIFIPREI